MDSKHIKVDKNQQIKKFKKKVTKINKSKIKKKKVTTNWGFVCFSQWHCAQFTLP